MTLVLTNGERVRYSSEVRQVQLVVDQTGELSMIHLILAKAGREKDTHEWYNFRNLAGFSYQYYALTGRARVSVVRTKPVPGDIEAIPDTEKVPVIRPDNYQ